MKSQVDGRTTLDNAIDYVGDGRPEMCRLIHYSYFSASTDYGIFDFVEIVLSAFDVYHM